MAVVQEPVVENGMDAGAAQAKAEAMSHPVYSSAQDDAKPSEDPWLDEMRADLRRYALDEDAEKQVNAEFQKRESPLSFLIVCHKLLTGFDAPLESVMYLDSPLADHNLLQAIARTNRVAGPKKRFGLIVDYIGITRKLDEALSAYREEDVENAMRDLDVERDALKQAHRQLFDLVGDIPRHTGKLDQEYDALVAALGTEDVWYTFRRKADAFISAYESLSPDPAVLDYRDDLKWVVGFIQYATPIIEKDPPPDLTGVSDKIRQLLEEHLDVTGLTTVVKLRQITDPQFWTDFDTDRPAEELRRATIRKATELKRITYEKLEENPLRYGKFSERVLEVIRRFEEGQLAAAEALKEFKQIAEDLQEEEQAHEFSGLNERAYGVLKILESLQMEREGGLAAVSEKESTEYGTSSPGDGPLSRLAQDIDAVYASDQKAPAGWHRKDQLRKGLRQEVRHLAYEAGFAKIAEVASRVEDYALRHYVKVA